MFACATSTCVQVTNQRARRGHPPDLESHLIVSCLTWVLRAKPGSLQEQYELLTAEPVSQ